MSDLQPPEGEGYNLQRVYAEKAKPFWFFWEDRWWKLPNLQMLDFEVQIQVAEFDFGSLTEDSAGLAEAKEKVNSLFDLIMGEEQGPEWRKTVRPINMINDMLRSWGEHSGSESGESSASDGSSKSTGRPSKPTSKGSTGSASRRRSPARKAAAPRVSS